MLSAIAARTAGDIPGTHFIGVENGLHHPFTSSCKFLCSPGPQFPGEGIFSAAGLGLAPALSKVGAGEELGPTTTAPVPMIPNPMSIQVPTSIATPAPHTGFGPATHANSKGFGASPIVSKKRSGFS